MRFYNKFKFLTLLTGILLSAMVSSCQDEPIYDPGAIPDGEVELTGEVTFRPLVEVINDQSRSGETNMEGTVAPKDQALLAINKLTILFYDSGKNLVREYSGPVSFTSNWQPREEDGTNIDEKAAETKTPRATFKKNIRSGIYYIYAVANLDIDLDKVTTIDDLRSVRLVWTPSNISSNIEMFGVFTKGDAGEARNIGFEEDQALTLPPSTITIHAWARRAVSKITIDFDGSKLRNNVEVYIKSARVVDIADGCYLGKTSKIGSNNGEFGISSSAHVLRYGPGDDFHNWPFVARGSKKFDSYIVGKDTINFHNEYAYCLPCYENMQGKGELKYQDKDHDGVIDNPGSGDPDHKFYKDAMPNGTYLEVEGYYVSKNADYLSSGPITYRFMLGKDVDDNYDIERNHHYKVTMSFLGNGNDVDWHVDYKEKTPSIQTTDVYASYSYNEAVTIPVRILGGRVMSLEAEIIENNWHPQENVGGDTYYENNASLGFQSTWKSDKYFGYVQDGTKHPGNGFLTLYARTANDIVSPWLNGDVRTYVYNEWYWNGKQGSDMGGDGSNITNGAGSGKTIGHRIYTNGTYYEDNGHGVAETWFNVEAYTRQKNLVKNTGYSGANIYETGNRLARVKFTAEVEVDGMTHIVRDTVSVLQSRRIVNPAAIYRSADNNKSFHVNLKVAEVEPSKPENQATGTYRPLKSRGPWRAVIENVGNPGMINLSQYWGDHDSEIDFDVNFAANAPNPSFAIISIYYHNYSCHHRIFVRKGYKPSAVIDGGVEWHAGNALYRSNSKIYDVDDPTDEGSLFRYANLSYAISSVNSFNYGFSATPGNLVIRESTIENNGSRAWSGITSPSKLSIANNSVPKYSLIEAYNAGSGKTPANNTSYAQALANGQALVDSLATRPAAYDDFYAFYNNNDVGFAYGVVYGDDATETASTMRQAYQHNSDYSQTTNYGMRAVIVFNKNDARHVMFPIGTTGYGHRQNGGGGALRYAGRGVLMPDNLAESRPVFWNIMYSKGAVYWLAMFDHKRPLSDGSGTYPFSTAWDMNYTSFDFYPYGTDATSGNSETATNYSSAAFIRMVDKP